MVDTVALERPTAKIHPAQRRRMQAKMPPIEHHEVMLRPLGGGGSEQMIISAGEDSFIEAVLDDLKQDDWETLLEKRRGLRHKEGSALLKLSQPVHRRFHLALYELQCRMPGLPPLDPKKIAGMGLVLRRRLADDRGQYADMAWVKRKNNSIGWASLAGSADLDPDPEKSFPLFPAASEALKAVAALRNNDNQPSEEILPLFVAPPDVCKARKRTIIFGVIPVSSNETSAVADDPVDFGNLDEDDTDALYKHYVTYFKEAGERALPKAGETLDPEWKPLEDQSDPLLSTFALFLKQLSVELGAFEDSEEGRSLLQLFATLQLPMKRNSVGHTTETMRADVFLEAAAPILVAQEANSGGLKMPLSWPEISEDQEELLIDAATGCLSRRASDFQPATPKFDNDAWQYRVRGFVRIRHGLGCPERLTWGEHSEPFVIAPWWDNDGPPKKISLPKISDLRKAKPNVAFEMPPSLANLMNQDPSKLIEGKGKAPDEIGLGWLCSFSIPIITICAFIVLNIFLQLFNIVFSWMMWIKICIPIPTKKDAQ